MSAPTIAALDAEHPLWAWERDDASGIITGTRGVGRVVVYAREVRAYYRGALIRSGFPVTLAGVDDAVSAVVQHALDVIDRARGDLYDAQRVTSC